MMGPGVALINIKILGKFAAQVDRMVKNACDVLAFIGQDTNIKVGKKMCSCLKLLVYIWSSIHCPDGPSMNVGAVDKAKKRFTKKLPELEFILQKERLDKLSPRHLEAEG